MKKATKLSVAIAISLSFFFVELVIGIRQGSLALVADAFHIASDIIGFVIALVAVRLADRRTGYPSTFSYGLQRAPTVGAFFNGCFLTGLGFAILLQSIERLITPEEVDDPKLVLIVGGVGLALNILSALVVHDHGDHGHSHNQHDGNGHSHKKHDDHTTGAREEQQVSASVALQSIPDAHADHVHTTRVLQHKSGYDLGLLGAMIHLVGDALNSVAVMISAVMIWQAHWQRADGVASVIVSLMIIATAIPLLKRSGRLLLEIAPQGLDLVGVEKDIKSLKGVEDVHELHAYSLTQTIHIASLHVTVAPETTIQEFVSTAKNIRECLHAWGLHGGVTCQPELADIGRNTIASASTLLDRDQAAAQSTSIQRPGNPGGLSWNSKSCQIQDDCGEATCCTD